VRRTARRKNGGSNVDIGFIHEYGFMGVVVKNGTPYFLHIPARAHFGPTLREIAPELAERWRKRMMAALDRSLS